LYLVTNINILFSSLMHLCFVYPSEYSASLTTYWQIILPSPGKFLQEGKLQHTYTICNNM